MERWFQAFDRYTEQKLSGAPLTNSQKLTLAYLIKSEWANEQLRYTILLTPDNNHFHEIEALERAGLLSKHPAGTAIHPVYVADRTLVRREYTRELTEKFGAGFPVLDELAKQALGVVYRANAYSKTPGVSAKMASFSLWASQGRPDDDIRAFDAFYRKVRRVFNHLEKTGFVKKARDSARIAYVLDG
jgi:hypothetical protein